MRLIIIEDTVYKVSEKEYKKLEEVNIELKDALFNEDKYFDLEAKMQKVIDENKAKYKTIGTVDFDWRI